MFYMVVCRLMGKKSLGTSFNRCHLLYKPVSCVELFKFLKFIMVYKEELCYLTLIFIFFWSVQTSLICYIRTCYLPSFFFSLSDWNVEFFDPFPSYLILVWIVFLPLFFLIQSLVVLFFSSRYLFYLFRFSTKNLSILII